MTVQGREGGPVYQSSNNNTQQSEIDKQKVDSPHVAETMDVEREKNIPKEIDYSNKQTSIDNKVDAMHLPKDKASISPGPEKVAAKTDTVAKETVFTKKNIEAPKLAQKSTIKSNEMKLKSEKQLKSELENCEKHMEKINKDIGKSIDKKHKVYENINNIKSEIESVKTHLNSIKNKKMYDKQGFSKNFDELNNQINALQKEVKISQEQVFEMGENVDALVKKYEFSQTSCSKFEMEMSMNKLKSSKDDLEEKMNRLSGSKNEHSENVKNYVDAMTSVLNSKLSVLHQLKDLKEKNDHNVRG